MRTLTKSIGQNLLPVCKLFIAYYSLGSWILTLLTFFAKHWLTESENMYLSLINCSLEWVMLLYILLFVKITLYYVVKHVVVLVMSLLVLLQIQNHQDCSLKALLKYQRRIKHRRTCPQKLPPAVCETFETVELALQM